MVQTICTAVFKARMLYAHFNPAMDYNNLVICNNAGVFKNGKGLFDDEDSLLNNLSGVKNIESKKILAENEMIIYPNPFNSEFLINYRLVQNGTIQWQLFDVLGREIYSTILDKNVQTKNIQLPYLSIGSYYYKTMVDGNVINTGKLIKY